MEHTIFYIILFAAVIIVGMMGIHQLNEETYAAVYCNGAICKSCGPQTCICEPGGTSTTCSNWCRGLCEEMEPKPPDPR